MKTFLTCAFSLVVVLAVSARSIVVGIAETCSTNRSVVAGSEYAKSVYAAGAVPFVLPATTNREELAALVGNVDMVLLCGGGDVDPRRYGEEDRGKIGGLNLRRDAWEYALMDEAVRQRRPLLGICRGCQILNVRFGGSLWQDVPSEVTGAQVHRIKDEHPISVVPGTKLSALLGQSSVSVNSRHHQSVRRLAPGFKVTATAADGVVEAIESTDYPALGVQFHPESLFARSGRREFLPLFRGSFADLKPRKDAPTTAR